MPLLFLIPTHRPSRIHAHAAPPFIYFRLVVSCVQLFPPSTQPKCRLRLGAPEPHPAYYALDCPGPCLVPGNLAVYAGITTAKAQYNVYLLTGCLLLLVLGCGVLGGLRYETPNVIGIFHYGSYA